MPINRTRKTPTAQNTASTCKTPIAGKTPTTGRTGATAKPTYRATLRERALVKTLRARRKAAPRLAVSKTGGGHMITPDHADPAIGTARLMQAVGTDDPDFLAGLLGQLARACSKGEEIDAGALAFMLSVVKGVEPRDQVEALIGAQMAAIHAATMSCARRLQSAQAPAQAESAERALSRLARTFAAQAEGLKRYRMKGEQKVTVEHVTVNEGGRAIVGHVRAGGRGEDGGHVEDGGWRMPGEDETAVP